MDWFTVTIVAAVLLGFFVLKRTSLISGAKASDLLRRGALVVDVRGPEEFNACHLPGAVNLPLGSLSSGSSHRFPDKNQVLLLHCLSGTRSGIAKRKLKGMGYSNVFNLGSYHRAETIVSKN